MADIEFIDGLIVKAPHERAPDFVKASISIKVADMKKWLAGRNDEWINVDVKESRGGKWYAAVSQYKKDDAKKSSQGAQPVEDDVPFNSINRKLSMVI